MSIQRNLQPIQTAYRGYLFRSRLEARWAVFFDSLGLKWEYEPEGFVLADGTWYLPDFWLPKFHNREIGLWVEVKPAGGSFLTAKMFAVSTGHEILCADGTPDNRPYDVFCRGEYGSYYEGLFNEKYITGNNKSEYRLYTSPACPEDLAFVGDDVLMALKKARSARFEHGQQPRV